MANELRLDVTMQYSDANLVQAFNQVLNFLASPAALLIHKGTQIVPTTDTVLNIGTIASLGFLMIRNLDATNYVDVTTGTGGKLVARLNPGWPTIIPCGPDMAAPHVIAHTASVSIDVLAVSL